MDNEAIFAAEADAETGARIGGSSRASNRYSADDGVDKGGINELGEYGDNEDSPLLEGGSSGQSDRDPAFDDGEIAIPEWHGLRDFNDLPWWRKPSVCQLPLLIILRLLT
jgi:hypothetical protein